MFAGILGRRILMNSKKLMIMIVAVAILASAFTVAICTENDVVDADNNVTVYVGGEYGNDNTGDGTLEKPYATITKSLTVSGVTDIVLVGNVNETTLWIKQSVNISALESLTEKPKITVTNPVTKVT